jgi:hypothetical protein
MKPGGHTPVFVTGTQAPRLAISVVPAGQLTVDGDSETHPPRPATNVVPAGQLTFDGDSETHSPVVPGYPPVVAGPGLHAAGVTGKPPLTVDCVQPNWLGTKPLGQPTVAGNTVVVEADAVNGVVVQLQLDQAENATPLKAMTVRQ